MVDKTEMEMGQLRPLTRKVELCNSEVGDLMFINSVVVMDEVYVYAMPLDASRIYVMKADALGEPVDKLPEGVEVSPTMQKMLEGS